MYDQTLTVEVPARLLHELQALAAGYTMSRGQFIGKSAIAEARDILWNARYEYGFDTEIMRTD